MTPDEASRILHRFLRSVPARDVPLEVMEAFLALRTAAGLDEGAPPWPLPRELLNDGSGGDDATR